MGGNEQTCLYVSAHDDKRSFLHIRAGLPFAFFYLLVYPSAERKFTPRVATCFCCRCRFWCSCCFPLALYTATADACCCYLLLLAVVYWCYTTLLTSVSGGAAERKAMTCLFNSSTTQVDHPSLYIQCCKFPRVFSQKSQAILCYAPQMYKQITETRAIYEHGRKWLQFAGGNVRTAGCLPKCVYINERVTPTFVERSTARDYYLVCFFLFCFVCFLQSFDDEWFQQGRIHSRLLTLTRCRSIGFIMEPWKNSTVVKWRLKRPSSSRSGGFLQTPLSVIKWEKKIEKLLMEKRNNQRRNHIENTVRRHQVNHRMLANLWQSQSQWGKKNQKRQVNQKSSNIIIYTL